MKDNFDPCLKLVLESEGGNSDDPRDPGGRTSRGITQREYDAYCRTYHQELGDVWNASDADVSNIYYLNYWKPWGDQFPSGVDYLWFDMAVNTGPVEAAKLLQRALGVKDDGHIGIVTLHALSQKNPKALITAISNQRRAFYRSLRTFRYFGKGWLARVDRSESDAMGMAA